MQAHGPVTPIKSTVRSKGKQPSCYYIERFHHTLIHLPRLILADIKKLQNKKGDNNKNESPEDPAGAGAKAKSKPKGSAKGKAKPKAKAKAD